MFFLRKKCEVTWMKGCVLHEEKLKDHFGLLFILSNDKAAMVADIKQ